MSIYAKARRGGTRSFSYLYWSWIRHVATEEGVALPQSGTGTDSLTGDESKNLASALKARAKKIRGGVVERDAASYVQHVDKHWFPQAAEGEDVGGLTADFDDPDQMDETAKFFESSGGVVLKY